jgi:predicted Zn-dependent protease
MLRDSKFSGTLALALSGLLVAGGGMWAGAQTQDPPKTPPDATTPDVTPAPASTTTKTQTTKEKKKVKAKEDPDEIGNRDVGKGVNMYSLEKEIAMGKGLANEIERQAKLCDDPVITEYINRVGQNLVRNSDCKVPVTIKVIDTDEPNAMALPGGFFFVNTGLITLAENEAEVAGVMGHELAHIAARHGTRQATRGQIANLATIPLIFMGGWTGYGIRQAVSILIPVGFLAFSRAFESEADMLGLEYMYKAGYDPNGFVDFFERLQALEKRKPGAVSKIFSSHPPTDDRIKAAQENIARLLKEKPEYVVTTSEFDAVRDRLALLNNRHKAAPGTKDDAGRPQLKKAPGGSTTPVESGDGTSAQPKEDPDERPTLKRRN